ncbi:MAG: hypothetical protein AAF939_15195 [Planctomycetota bacterium]
MLSRNFGPSREDEIRLQWEELNQGAATILGFAALCQRAMLQTTATEPELINQQLSQEAKAILVASRNRGTLDIRAMRESFDSAERFLAVCVEHELNCHKLFLDKMQPEQTIRFLQGFKELCNAGFVIHHLQKDFSLSAKGFDYARTIEPADVQTLLDFATEIEL